MNPMDRDLPKRRSSLARTPEIVLGGFAFLLSFPWEMIQSPLFEGMVDMPHWDGVKYCTRAAFGDTAIMLVAFWVVAAATGRGRSWLTQSGRMPVVAIVLVGVVIAVVIEALATSGRWLEGWTYSVHMPMVPGTNIGLVPILQWIILPPMAVLLARRQLRWL